LKFLRSTAGRAIEILWEVEGEAKPAIV
jgi:hypothetical protein